MKFKQSVQFVSLIAVCGWMTFGSIQEAKAEVQKLTPLTIDVLGRQSGQALHDIFRKERLPLIIQKYHPEQADWDWKSKGYQADRKGVTFRYSMKYIAPTETWTEYFYAKVGEFMLRDIVGQVTVKGLQCEAPADKQGYKVTVDLGQSSSIVVSTVSAIVMDICIEQRAKGTDEETSHAELKMLIHTGKDFPGMQDPYVQSFVDAQRDAWFAAFSNAATIRQGEIQ